MSPAARTRGPVPVPLDAQMMLARIRGEYRDMPGLQLTCPQAARLLGLDATACGVLLHHLTDLGHLRCLERGQYVLAVER